MREGLLTLGILLIAALKGSQAARWLDPGEWWENLPGTPVDAEVLQAIRAARLMRRDHAKTKRGMGMLGSAVGGTVVLPIQQAYVRPRIRIGGVSQL